MTIFNVLIDKVTEIGRLSVQ